MAAFSLATSALAAPVISEFMASNGTTLADENGEFTDWIEIHNPDATAIDLSGWYLTDDSSLLNKWTFPPTTLNPGEYLVVFASGKDRATSGSELHTNFKLSAEGEYLALVQPDGSTRSSEFAPTFPEQSQDVSFGFAGLSSTLVDRDSNISYLIPTDGTLGTTWTNRLFDDSTWTASAPLIENVPSTDVSKNTQQDWTTTSNLIVTSSNPIQDLDLRLDMRHRNLSDLTLTLRSPAGTTVTLVAGEGGSQNHFTGTIFDDEADTAIGSGSAPFTGRYRPENNLAAFDGENPSGTWVLSITDVGSSRIGTLTSWSLDIASSDNSNPLKQGVGYEESPDSGTSFTSEISTTLPIGTVSTYVRIPFNLDNAAKIESLLLKMKYDDGFVAYLNGTKIAEANAPASPLWSSQSSAGHDDLQALEFISFDVSNHRSSLLSGTNVLAIHMLNQNSGSSDYLMSCELSASESFDPATAVPGFLSRPTPGSANNANAQSTGPHVTEVTTRNTILTSGDPLVVSARLDPKNAAVAGASLVYRVNFNPEVTLSMNDNGTDGDNIAGDGIWTATIPAQAHTGGDMLRWFVLGTDDSGRQTREPLAVDPLAPEYFGVAIDDQITTNGIARFRWWVENPDWYWTGNVGSSNIHKEYTSCSVWYDNQFYDNVRVRTRGASSVYGAYPKQSLHFNFHASKRFQWIHGEAPTDRVNLNNIWVDQAYLRNDLSMKTFAACGVTASASRMVLVHEFGNDPTVSNLVEHPGEEFLDRHGLDSQGALYKIYNRLANATDRPEWTPGTPPNSLVGVEKKTRLDEDNNDLQNFIDTLGDSNANRQRDLCDQLNLPKTINYMAASVIDQGFDVFVKNNFVYRDTEGTGEWEMIPWDRDVSWGPSQWNTNNIIYSSDSKSHPYFGSGINGGEKYPIFEAVIDEPLTRQLFVRRLRTLMEEQLQPPGTNSGDLIFEAMINDFVTATNRINPPNGEATNWVQLDKDIWGKLRGTQSSSLMQTLDQAIDDITTTYLPNRRIHLFDTMGPSGSGIIPPQQPSTPQIVIGSIDFNPASGNQDEEFIELINLETEAVDISGWSLGNAVDHSFIPGTVIPGYDPANPEANRLYVSPSSTAFRARAISPTGGESRLVQSSYSGHLSSFGETINLHNDAGVIVDTHTYAGDPSLEQLYLVVSEIMYHPASNPDAEFIELYNISDNQTLDLNNVRFTKGIDFDFTGSAVTSLAPGEKVIVCKNITAFEAIHGSGLPVAGAWITSSLNNDGETIKLEDASNSTIKEFTYNDAFPWPRSADGQGASLVLIQPTSNPDPDIAANWRASSLSGGTPGNTPAPPALPTEPHADGDGNGRSDLVDYGLSGPVQFTISPIDLGEGTRNYPTLEFHWNANAELANATVQYSTDMVNWSHAPEQLRMISETFNNNGTVSYRWQSLTPVTESPHQFLRIQVQTR